jgi:hypothetical protein
LWRTASTLFPDDYEETYGFGILPRWLDFGVGGGIGDYTPAAIVTAAALMC